MRRMRFIRWTRVHSVVLLTLAMGAGATAGCARAADPPAATESASGWEFAGGVRLEKLPFRFEQPVHLCAPPGDRRLFVVEQPGRVRIVVKGVLRTRPFLDLGDRVRSGGERGLLSIAFHPRYASNGLLFVNYTDREGNTRIERYRVSARDPELADKASATLILAIDQPYANHNGGHLLFDPDGKLLIPMGDGGSGGDPQGRAQNPESLLGKLLRIDVDAGAPYRAVRTTRAGTLRPEIWATGLRNPWRVWVDPPTRLLYIADVGQNQWEEIDVAPLDRERINYGWNMMEGTHCYHADDCRKDSLMLPVAEYNHGNGCSITGGVVYRGTRIPALAGRYLFTDYCAGWLRSFRFDRGTAIEKRQYRLDKLESPTSFGVDSDGEVYVLSHGGEVFRLVPSP